MRASSPRKRRDEAGLPHGERGRGAVAPPSIELPWPDKVLSPNARTHWGPRARATVKHKSWAHTAALVWRYVNLPQGPLVITLTACPPDKRARDLDNVMASCKAYLDGISYSLGIDDSRFRPRIEWGEPVRHGKIIVTMEAA